MGKRPAAYKQPPSVSKKTPILIVFHSSASRGTGSTMPHNAEPLICAHRHALYVRLWSMIDHFAPSIRFARTRLKPILELDEMLQRIRSERHIRPATFKCAKCGYVGEGAEPHVSVRAMILSVIRFGIAAAELTYKI